MTYEIRVRDHLDVSWADWFDGWEVTNLEGGDVLLTSTVADQSALHGALNKIRDLNLKLISVVGAPPTGAQMPRPQTEKEEPIEEKSHESHHENHSQ
jgi:hypothetical protein